LRELADAVHLSPNAVAEHFRRLLADGTINHIRATLMTGSFDYAVRVACIDRDDLVSVTETLRQRAGVRETYTRLLLREVRLSGS